MKSTQARRRRPRWVRWLRGIGIALAVLLVLVVGALVGGFAWLRSDGGRSFLVAQIKAALPAGLTLEMSQLDGPLPAAAHIRELTLSDGQGPFLHARDLDLKLNLAALLAKQVQIDNLGAVELTVTRAPVLPPSPTPAPAAQPSGGLLPALPFSLRLDRLALEKLGLGEALIQQPGGAALKIDGKAELRSGGNGLSADLAIDRTDGVGGQLRLKAELDPRSRKLMLDLAAAEPAGGVVASLANLPGKPPLGLRIWGDGSADAWKGRIEAREGDAQRLGGDLGLSLPEAGQVHLTFDGDVQPGDHVPAQYADIVGAKVPLSLAVLASQTAQTVTVEKLSLLPAAGRLDLTGRADLAAQTVAMDGFLRAGAPVPGLKALVQPLDWQALEARVKVDGPFTAPAIGLEASLNRPDAQDIAAEHVDLTASLRMVPNGPWPVDAKLDVAEPSGLPSQAEALIGHHATVTLAGRVDAAAGRLQNIEGALRAADLEAALTGSAGGDALDLNWHLLRFAIPDLVRATGDGRIAGPPAAAALSARLLVTPSEKLGVPISPLSVDASTALGPQQKVDLRVTGEAWNAPLLLAATILQQPATPPEEQLLIRLEDLRLAGFGARGDLVLPPGATYPSGTLNLTQDGALPAGVPGSGQLTGKLILPAPALPVTGTAPKAEGAPAEAAPAQGKDPMSAQLVLAGPRVTVGGQDISDLALDVAVAMPPDGRIVARLARLGLTVQEQKIALRQPLTVTVQQGAISTSAIDVAVGPGTLSGQISRAGNGLMTGKIATSAIALSALPNMPKDTQGKLTVTADLGATEAGKPNWTVKASIPDLRVPGGEQLRLAPQPISVTATWNGERLSVDLDAGRGTTSFTGNVGFALPASGGVPAPDMNAALSGKLGGRLDLSLLMPIVAIAGDRIAGRTDLAGTVSGTLTEPEVLGSATLVGVGYWRPELGLAVTRGSGSVRFTGDAIVVEKVSFMTPGGGTLGLSGRIGLPPTGAISLNLAMRRAKLVDSDMGNALISANLSVTGSTQTPRIAGLVTLDESNIIIPDRLASSIPNLNVREKNGPPQPPPVPARRTVPQERHETKGPGGSDPVLDVTIRIARPMRVTGRGLDATVGGQIVVRGTASKPLPDGSFTLQRGNFQLLGRELEFDRGIVKFSPDTGLTPVLDFRAGLTENSITVYVTVTGTPDRLKLELSSEPTLPQDEILSRLLFGRESSQLTPLESIQLASAAADFAGIGGPSDLLGEAQGFFGLTDFLENGNALGDNVSVDVKQGASPLDTSVQVKVDLGNNINLNTNVGTTGAGGAGIGYEVDY